MVVSLLVAFGDEHVARQLIDAVLADDRMFADVDVPLRTWLKAVYLTDAGRLRVHPRHLASILDVSLEKAVVMVQRIDDFKDALAPLASCPPAAAAS
jgi:hypothetical protein